MCFFFELFFFFNFIFLLLYWCVFLYLYSLWVCSATARRTRRDFSSN